MENNDVMARNNIFAWIALGVGLLLCIPLVAMQFTQEVNWTALDFVAMGTLIFGMASLYVLAARKAPKHRGILALVFTGLFFWFWAELAVGVFTNIGS